MNITRLKLVDPVRGLPRIAGAVVAGDLIYLSGITGAPAGDVRTQTRDALALIDRLLAEAASHKSLILTAQVWLSDISLFAAHNEIWNEWVDHDAPPARACVEAKLYRPELLVEIMVSAARRA